MYTLPVVTQVARIHTTGGVESAHGSPQQRVPTTAVPGAAAGRAGGAYLTSSDHAYQQYCAQATHSGQDQAGLLALQGDLGAQDEKHREYIKQLQDITNRLDASGLHEQVALWAHALHMHITRHRSRMLASSRPVTSASSSSHCWMRRSRSWRPLGTCPWSLARRRRHFVQSVPSTRRSWHVSRRNWSRCNNIVRSAPTRIHAMILPTLPFCRRARRLQPAAL